MLSQEEVKVIISLAEEFFNKIELYKEDPFPKCSEAEIDALAKCCERVEWGYYKDIYEKLSALIYNICKGHFLTNGNKRAATLVFILIIIKYNLISKSNLNNIEKILDIIINIASSNPKTRESTINQTTKELRTLLK